MRNIHWGRRRRSPSGQKQYVTFIEPHGPEFFNTNSSPAALWRGREADGGATYNQYFSKLTRLLRERQQSNGSFPFPRATAAPSSRWAQPTARTRLRVAGQSPHTGHDEREVQEVIACARGSAANCAGGAGSA